MQDKMFARPPLQNPQLCAGEFFGWVCTKCAQSKYLLSLSLRIFAKGKSSCSLTLKCFANATFGCQKIQDSIILPCWRFTQTFGDDSNIVCRWISENSSEWTTGCNRFVDPWKTCKGAFSQPEGKNGIKIPSVMVQLSKKVRGSNFECWRLLCHHNQI